MGGFKRAGVPVVPNASRVQGKLLQIIPEPDGQGSVWEIAVSEARDVEGLPNFAAAYVGKTIAVYVHPALEHECKVGDLVRARVAYRGDERGGRFALEEDDLQKV